MGSTPQFDPRLGPDGGFPAEVPDIDGVLTDEDFGIAGGVPQLGADGYVDPDELGDGENAKPDYLLEYGKSWVDPRSVGPEIHEDGVEVTRGTALNFAGNIFARYNAATGAIDIDVPSDPYDVEPRGLSPSLTPKPRGFWRFTSGDIANPIIDGSDRQVFRDAYGLHDLALDGRLTGTVPPRPVLGPDDTLFAFGEPDGALRAYFQNELTTALPLNTAMRDDSCWWQFLLFWRPRPGGTLYEPRIAIGGNQSGAETTNVLFSISQHQATGELQVRWEHDANVGVENNLGFSPPAGQVSIITVAREDTGSDSTLHAWISTRRETAKIAEITGLTSPTGGSAATNSYVFAQAPYSMLADIIMGHAAVPTTAQIEAQRLRVFPPSRFLLTGGREGGQTASGALEADGTLALRGSAVPGSPGTVELQGKIRKTGIVTIGPFSAQVDNLGVTSTTDENVTTGWDISQASVVRASASAAVDLTGIAGGVDGRELELHNVGAETITLKDEDTDSDAANRLALTADVELAQDAAVLLRYDGTSERWRAIGGAGGESSDADTLDTLDSTQFLRSDEDDHTTGRLGVGVAPDTGPQLHVQKGSAGTGPAWDATDVALFEAAAAGHGRVNIFTAADKRGGYVMSDPGGNVRGGMYYDHATDRLALLQDNTERAYVDQNGIELMAGDVTLVQDATDPLHAVPLGQVEALITNLAGSVLDAQTTAAGNVGTGEDDLMSFALSGEFATDGDVLEIVAWGAFAANSNNKQVKLDFGSVTICDSGAAAFSGSDWVIRATIIRTGSDTQTATAQFLSDDALASTAVSTTLLSGITSTTATIKCTGEATSDNDIVQRGMVVKVGVSASGTGRELVGEVIVSGSAATTMEVSGLDGDADGVYFIEFQVENGAGANSAFSLYIAIDGGALDTTAAHYGIKPITGSGSNHAQWSNAMSAGETGAGFGHMSNYVDGYPMAFFSTTLFGITSAVGGTSWNWAYDFASGNITSIGIHAGTADGCGVGSYLKVWKVSR